LQIRIRVGRKSASGSGMNNPDHIFQSFEKFFGFFGVKYLNSMVRIRDGDSSDPKSGMEKSRIRDKHPGSATLIKKNIRASEGAFYFSRQLTAIFYPENFSCFILFEHFHTLLFHRGLFNIPKRDRAESVKRLHSLPGSGNCDV
jgi:hypothetical protein